MQHSMTFTGPQPQAGPIEDIEREDDAKGYEPEELVDLHRLVAHLRLDGDRRAACAGRQARRTLAQMAGR
ncbi:hypothetical protein [Streptomyces tsukubensis]|uniref:hypothetical protein n=1 Tax=Streptomyces tsukubensis TaxID=83656 RepID=UPI00344BB24D